MTKDLVRSLANFVALAATITVNGLANALPINGQTTGEISDRFDVYFVPAGYVFSIWGLIYLGLTAFAIYQLLPAQRQSPRLRRVGWLFVLSSLANITWILLWHYNQFALTVVVMLVLLGSLIGIYERLGIGRQPTSGVERWVVDLPFSIYLGWVSVATIANITSALEAAGWNGWGIAEPVWAVIMLVVGAVLAVVMGLLRRDYAFMGVVVWAFVGIAIKQSDTALVANPAWVLAAAVLAAAVLASVRSRGSMRPASA
jgi:translocator protein